MQEQQLTRFYDKLLHYLNRTYFTNIRIQQLYLDLRKNTRKLRFKSIKNIYHTLTEGKADQVIYNRDKLLLTKNNSFNQKFTERICWRLIQKLVKKVAYYLMNEKKLSCLAPSILKTLHFARNAPDKASHKSSFVQFFSQVLDTLISQNNMLEQKIYQILIERGYIYSIDQFYKMSRFQGPNSDFTYTNPLEQDQNEHQSENQDKNRRSDFLKLNSSKGMTKQKNRAMSIKKFMHRKNRSKFEFESNDDQSDKIGQTLSQAQIIEEEQDEIQIQNDQQSQIQQILQNVKYNKIVHNIHNQVEKVVDQIMNHKDFDLLLTASDNSGIAFIKNDENLGVKQPIIKQVLKNLKIKNFKANQKLIIIDDKNIKQVQPQRKNSKPKRKQTKNGWRQKNSKNKQNRSSIATALNLRLREKVLQNSGIQQIKQLIVRNLGNLKDKIQLENNQSTQKVRLRKNKRLQTQNFDAHLEQNTKKIQRISSNLNFLRNAFVFNSNSNSKPGTNFLQKRHQKYSDAMNQSSMSSQNVRSTVKTIEQIRKNRKETKQRHETKNSQRNSLFSNEKIAQFSRFAQNNHRCGHEIEVNDLKKRSNKDNIKFNTNLLQLAAKKYYRYQAELNRKQNFQELFSNLQTRNILSNLRTLQIFEKKGQKIQQPYMHHRKYQTFDRIQKRIF